VRLSFQSKSARAENVNTLRPLSRRINPGTEHLYFSCEHLKAKRKDEEVSSEAKEITAQETGQLFVTRRSKMIS
jgi:hypothetical protein